MEGEWGSERTSGDCDVNGAVGPWDGQAVPCPILTLHFSVVLPKSAAFTEAQKKINCVLPTIACQDSKLTLWPLKPISCYPWLQGDAPNPLGQGTKQPLSASGPTAGASKEGAQPNLTPPSDRKSVV